MENKYFITIINTITGEKISIERVKEIVDIEFFIQEEFKKLNIKNINIEFTKTNLYHVCDDSYAIQGQNATGVGVFSVIYINIGI